MADTGIKIEQDKFEDHVPIKAKFGFGFASAGSSLMSAIGLGTIDVVQIPPF